MSSEKRSRNSLWKASLTNLFTTPDIPVLTSLRSFLFNVFVFFLSMTWPSITFFNNNFWISSSVWKCFENKKLKSVCYPLKRSFFRTFAFLRSPQKARLDKSPPQQLNQVYQNCKFCPSDKSNNLFRQMNQFMSLKLKKSKKKPLRRGACRKFFSSERFCFSTSRHEWPLQLNSRTPHSGHLLCKSPGAAPRSYDRHPSLRSPQNKTMTGRT